MRLCPRRAAIAFAVLVLMICLGWTAWWFHVAGELRAGLSAWLVERRADGWTVELGNPDVAGFPLRIDASFDAPRLAGPAMAGPGSPPRWTWAGPPVRATARPWALGDIRASAPGQHRIGVRGVDYEARAETADADIVAGGRRVRAVTLRLGGLTAVQIGRAPLTAEALSVGLAGDPAADDGVDVVIDAQGLVLPESVRPALGRRIARLSAEGAVSGPLAPAASTGEALRKWRDAGGAIDIRAFDLAWKSLELRATGTFALDADLQPQGAATAEIGGVDETVDALIAAGLIDARAAFAAKVANRALAAGSGRARLPLTIQERRLYVGPVALMRLPPIRWE